MLKYIISREKIFSENQLVNALEKVVSKIKKRPEVTKKYMQQWDRERHLVMDTKKEAAASAITFNRKHGISDIETKAYIINELGLSKSCADELFSQIDSKESIPN